MAGCEGGWLAAYTPGVVDDGHEMGTLIEGHAKNTGATVTTVVADSKYGTKENLLLCYDKDIQAHVPTMKAITSTTSSREGIDLPGRTVCLS
ncbi:MAG: hypothetical protein ABSB94_18915 [Syntrophorhabdales bacterium]